LCYDVLFTISASDTFETGLDRDFLTEWSDCCWVLWYEIGYSFKEFWSFMHALQLPIFNNNIMQLGPPESPSDIIRLAPRLERKVS
jgi:hypothetical protein